MLNRRSALAVLGTFGVGTSVFQRALAASAQDAPVSSQMVTDAEWVAGIKLTDSQREAVVNAFKFAEKDLQHLRPIELDNSLLPGIRFVPFVSPASLPDPRGYEITTIPAAAQERFSRPQSDEELAFCSIRQLGKLLRNREISSVELTKLYLDRLRRYDPLLKCVVTFMDELALKQAERADRELRANNDRGPLHGIPWGIKDILSYPGYPTTWGVTQYRNRMIDVKAAVAERLENAGSVLVAKLATNTLAGGSVLWFRGITRNPWNPRQDAAGSSSGSAVASAAGLVGFSIGTETTASLIGPSIVCGASGLRPTYGRVSRHGCMQLCWSLDKIGPICRNVDDCGVVLSAIHGADPRDSASVDRQYVWPSSRQVSTIRVGYVARDNDDKRDELRILRELGVTLIPVEPPNLKKDYGLPKNELAAGLVACESAAAFEELTRHGEPKGVKGWPQWFLLGHFLTAVDYLRINRLRSIVMQRFDTMMRDVDVYLCDEWIRDGNPPDDQWDWYANLTGHPMIVLPRKFETKDGCLVPKPLLMIGRIYDESTLLTLADACQRTLGLGHRPPLDRFLAQKDEILAGEEFPVEDKYYTE